MSGDSKDRRESFSQVLGGMINARSVAIALSAIVAVTFAGPFGTFDSLTFYPRALFWSVVILSSLLLGAVARFAALASFRKGPLWKVELGGVVVMTVLFAPFVWGVTRIFTPGPSAGIDQFGIVVLNVFVVVAAVSAIRLLVMRSTRSDVADPPPLTKIDDPELWPKPRLMRRLPEANQAAITRLMARDHHVDVVTDRGVATLRFRLSDAVAEMEPIDGFYTHRSHWVARDRVVGIVRCENKKLYVRLMNGDTVPLSRTYRPALEAAGFVPLDTPSPMAIVASEQPAAQAPLKQQSPPSA